MKKYFIHLCALLFIGFIACTKHDANPDDNNEFPLKLKVNKLNNGNIELTWDEVKVNGFSQYTITRQVDSTFFNFSTDTTWVIDNYSTTKIIDKNPPIEQFIYYKITAKSNNGINLRSALTAYEQKDILSVKNINFNTIHSNLANNEFYFFNGSNIISAYNIQTQTLNRNIIQTQQFNSLNFYFFPEHPNELYTREGLDMFVTSAQTFKNKVSFPFDNIYFIQSAVSNNENLFYTTNSDSYGGIKVYDTNTKTYIQDYKITSFFASSRSLRYLNNAKKLYMIDAPNTSNIMILTLNSTGNISSRSVVSLSQEWNSFYMFSPTKNQIISLNTGNVYDANFSKTSIISNLKNSTAASFSPDGKYFAYYDNVFRIRILETENFTEVNSYEVSSQFSSSQKSTFAGFGLSNDKVVIIYSRFNNFGTRDLNIFFKNINN